MVYAALFRKKAVHDELLIEHGELVLPMLEGEQRSENYKQLGRCYDELGMKEKADACWKESGFPRVRMASPGRRPSGNARSSRR